MRFKLNSYKLLNWPNYDHSNQSLEFEVMMTTMLSIDFIALLVWSLIFFYMKHFMQMKSEVEICFSRLKINDIDDTTNSTFVPFSNTDENLLAICVISFEDI
jgi:hypothetical protein